MNITTLLTYEEARQMLGVCRDKFKRMRQEGFPQVDVGKKRTKILLRDVEKYKTGDFWYMNEEEE